MSEQRVVQGRQLFAKSESGSRIAIQQYVTQINTQAFGDNGKNWIDGMSEYRRTDNGNPINVVGESPMVFQDIFDQTRFTEVV